MDRCRDARLPGYGRRRALVDRLAALAPDALSALAILEVERTHVLGCLSAAACAEDGPRGPYPSPSSPFRFFRSILPIPPPTRGALVFRGAWVVGEGETVFPRASFFPHGAAPGDAGVLASLTVRSPRARDRGRLKPLRGLLPATDHPINRPDAFGMEYWRLTAAVRCAALLLLQSSAYHHDLPAARGGRRAHSRPAPARREGNQARGPHLQRASAL
jgi:hypothetical protein